MNRRAAVVAIVSMLAAAGLLLLSSPPARAQEPHKGWETGSPYDKLYIPADREKFKGTVEKLVDVTPLPGMAPGVGFVATVDETGERVMVHAGPAAFIAKRAEFDILKPGAKGKIYGVHAEVEGKEVFLLNKIVVGDRQLKVRRTSTGMAWWNLSPEELAREEADNKVE